MSEAVTTLAPFRLPPLSPAAFTAAARKLRPRGGIFGRGLPRDGESMHALVVELCHRVRSRAGRDVSGKQLAEEMGLQGPRAVRQLLAFARVGYGLQEIIGQPGSGYAWGPAAPDKYKRFAGHAAKMGRDWLYIAALYGEGDAEANMAQMLLEFASTAHQRTALGLGDGGGDTGLADLAERRGVTLGGLLDRIVEFMRSHRDTYGADLDRVAQKHAATLVNTEAIRRVKAVADDMDAKLRDLRNQLGCMQEG